MSDSLDRNLEQSLSGITARVSIAEQDQRFQDTDFTVEATSLEVTFLWDEARTLGLEWKQIGGQLLTNCGYTSADGKEVTTNVSLSWWEIAHRRVLFWEAQDVDSQGIINRGQARAWIRERCGQQTEHIDAFTFRGNQRDWRPIE